MGFDSGKFMAAKLVAREESVQVPALSAWFDEGEEAVWVVRGLSSNELHAAMEAKARRESVDSIVRAITESGDQAKAVREAIGMTQGAPAEIVKRLEMLVRASISPAIDLPTAVKLAESFPIEFLTLTNTITSLTGLGHDLAKPAAASQPTKA